MLLHERRVGLCGGTVISLIPLIGMDELFRTVVLAIAGATVSFLVSYVLKRIMSRRGPCFDKLSMTERPRDKARGRLGDSVMLRQAQHNRATGGSLIPDRL